MGFIDGLIVSMFIHPLSEKWQSTWTRESIDKMNRDYVEKFRTKFIVVGVVLALALLPWMFVVMP